MVAPRRSAFFLPIVALAGLAVFPSQAQSAQSPSCRTPSGQSGQCVSLLNCESLSRLSRSGYVSSPEEKKLLRESACGSEIYQEKVCCPESSASGTRDTAADTPTTPRTTTSGQDEERDEDAISFESTDGKQDGDTVGKRRLFQRPSFGLVGGLSPLFGNTFTTRRPFNSNPFGGGDPFDSNPFNSNPSNSPFNSNPFNSNPFNSNPSNSPFNSNPFNSNPFNSNPFNSNPFNSNPFNSGEYSTTTTRRPFNSGVSTTTTRRPTKPRTTTRRPNRVTTTPRPSSQQGGAGGNLINADECGLSVNDRIVGGNSTVVLELPWMARLGYGADRRVSYRCGGSLISSRYVLTAAHCVGGRDDPTQVRLGEHDADNTEDCSNIAGSRVCAPPVVDVAVEEVIRHPQFSDDPSSANYLQNDIALLRLRRSVPFTEAVKPICLPAGRSSTTQNLEGKKAAVAGWGKDKNRGSSGTRFLMKANVPIMSYSQCARVYRQRSISLEEESQMCAGGQRGVDSCQGDSGGPLYRPAEVPGKFEPRVVQLGVVSFGLQNCAVEGVPGVYTRVQNYMPWITSNMRP